MRLLCFPYDIVAHRGGKHCHLMEPHLRGSAEVSDLPIQRVLPAEYDMELHEPGGP